MQISLAAVLGFLGAIFAPILGFWLYKVWYPRRQRIKKEETLDESIEEKEEAVKSLDWEKYTSDVEVKPFHANVSGNNPGGFMISDDMTEDDVREEVDDFYTQQKMIPMARYLFPDEESWRTTIKKYVTMKLCRKKGKNGKAEQKKRELKDNFSKKYQVIKDIDDKNRLKRVFAEARKRYKKDGAIPANQDEFIFLLKYWREYDFETYKIYGKVGSDKYVSDIDTSNKDAALLARGRDLDTAEEIREDLLDLGFEIKDGKETDWDFEDNEEPIEGRCDLLTR
ncbi:MAG: hypothetical protein ABEJ98_02105 [Candidatus Nanohaloarchaea archaeon]